MAKSAISASSRATTNVRSRTGRTPRILPSRRSGKTPSQITNVISPVAIIERTSASVRSALHAAVEQPARRYSQTYFFDIRIGATVDGPARNAITHTASWICGAPEGIRSLSNIRPKNIRVKDRGLLPFGRQSFITPTRSRATSSTSAASTTFLNTCSSEGSAISSRRRKTESWATTCESWRISTSVATFSTLSRT